MPIPLEARVLLRRAPGSLLLAGLTAAIILLTTAVQADTVFLKDGTQILDCQVVRETEASVSVRTPAGDMVVPRSQVFRIQKVKTPYDQYLEQLARLREGDVNALFKLAQWCRTAQGLRKESDELLAKVLELKADHEAARHLLGHLKVKGQWVEPPPLKLHLRVSGGAGMTAREAEEALTMFLKSRPDMVIASDKDATESLDDCTVTVTVTVGQRAAPKFFGKSMGRATIGASVRLKAKSDWLGKERAETAVEGEVPAGGPAAGNLAVKNAVGGGSAALHRFLDNLQQRRAKLLLAELKKPPPRKADPTESASRSTTSKPAPRPAPKPGSSPPGTGDGGQEV